MRKIKLTENITLDSGEFAENQTLLVSDEVGTVLLSEGKAVETAENGCWVDQTGASLKVLE